MHSTKTRHLDLGCGPVLRSNLTVETTPFESDRFDSVSAFDFLEHVPRVLPTADGRGTRFPFVELMNEISRVQHPDGLLYALKACYPSREAFQDPTHVNIVTDRPHL